MRIVASAVLLLFVLGFASIQLVKAQDPQPLLEYQIEELLDEYTRFPVRAGKMFKRKGFRCTGRISEVKKNEKEGGLLLTFKETPKRIVYLVIENWNSQNLLDPKPGDNYTFSAYVVFGGQASDGRFFIELREYYPGLPLARPVEPLQNEVQIARALRVIHTDQMISVDEINAILGKPFDQKNQVNDFTVIYKWVLGKHFLTIQLDKGKISGIQHERPRFK